MVSFTDLVTIIHENANESGSDWFWLVLGPQTRFWHKYDQY